MLGIAAIIVAITIGSGVLSMIASLVLGIQLGGYAPWIVIGIGIVLWTIGKIKL
jgi:hypothetical protein